MGWWDYGVMSGDTPCDYEIDLRFFIDSKSAERYSKDEISEEELMEHLKVKCDTEFLPHRLVEWADRRRRNPEIALQVVGVTMMALGIPISDELKDKIICATEIEILGSESFRDPAKRRRSMAVFIDDIINYDGTKPTELSEPDEGVIAKILGGLSDGQE